MEELMTTDEPFVIKTDLQAEWGIRKIKEAVDEKERMTKTASEMIAYYQGIIDDAEKRCEGETRYIKSMLREYFNGVPTKETKTQFTYRLPSGTLKMTKAKLDLEKNDESLLSYLKKNCPEMVQTTEKPMWGEFKKHLTIVNGKVINEETGEVIDCITIVEKPESFEVKL